MREKIENLCIELSRNELLVQGAGGNISWKDDNRLHVKASGKWLSKAKQENCFVAVQNSALDGQINRRTFDHRNLPGSSDGLRPSIEVFFHALLNQKVVLHTHPVDLVARMIQAENSEILRDLDRAGFASALVPYATPGRKLAEQIHSVCRKTPEVDVIALDKHGLITAGETVSEVLLKTTSVLDLFYTSPHNQFTPKKTKYQQIGKYQVAKRDELNVLATDPTLFKYIKRNWRICPDHVIFCGVEPFFVEMAEQISTIKEKCPVIFVKDVGVFIENKMYDAIDAQLSFFLNVIRRLDLSADVRQLSFSDGQELLDMEQEKYRQAINA